MKLKVLIEGQDLASFNLKEGNHILGRGKDVGYVATSEKISRKHLEIQYQSGKIMLKDLGSTNGTIVDGVRLEKAATKEIQLGSKVKLGEKVELRFVTSNKLPHAPSSKAKSHGLITPSLKDIQENFNNTNRLLAANGDKPLSEVSISKLLVKKGIQESLNASKSEPSRTDLQLKNWLLAKEEDRRKKTLIRFLMLVIVILGGAVYYYIHKNSA